MDEIVVTATKTMEKRKDIPNAVIVMDEMDIQESPATSVGDLLANELGVDWRTRGNYGGAAEEIHIRGMDGDATQVLVNGVSVNSPSLGSADVGSIPLNNIERIEVVKGSGSLLYGSGAMGGTINIITKRPERDKMDLNVNAGYGSENTYQLSAEQGMFVVGDLGYYLTANRRETDGFRDNSDLTHNDASLKLVLDKGNILDISLYGDYIDREYGRPGVRPAKGTQDYYISGVKFYNSEAASLLDKGGDEDAHLALQVKSEPAEWLAFNLRGDYTYMENYNYTRYNSSGAGNETWVTNEVLGTEGNVDIKPFKGANLLLGVEYKDYDWENENLDLDATGAEVAGSRSVDKADLYTTGTFAEAQYRPCKFFKVLAGIRHEDHSEFGTENLPLYGMIINPLENTALKMSHGKHFLAPTPNDLFWPAGPFVQGNPNLKPETGWHTDATVEQTLIDNKIFITVSYFHWDIDNKIRWAPDSSWVWTPQNLDSYTGEGWEVGTTIGPFYNMRVAFNYTYTDAEEKNEFVTRQATYTPEHQFKGTVIYRSDRGTTATATARYVSDRPYYGNDNTITTPTNVLDSYWTMDIKLEQRLFDRFLFSLQGNNLFDEGYDTYLSSFTDQNTSTTTVEGYPGAERSVFFRITYEY
ncbi:MAG: TonB-dependent receptor [Pseudomonadota bacterium]